MEFSAPSSSETSQQTLEPYRGLDATVTFRAGRFRKWSSASLGVGMLGSRILLESVGSGIGAVMSWDMDSGTTSNLGNQVCQPGVPKVVSSVEACDRHRPGVASGFYCDVRHADLGHLFQCNVLLDCSDDAGLSWFLTEISNGIGIPLLRCAVDGSGQYELGRVLCSSSASGHACQQCPYSLADYGRAVRRTPCPDVTVDDAVPTRAGGAIASVVAGLAMLQAQRLMTGNDIDRVLGRDVIVDMSHQQILDIELPRSDRCLSGHQRWELIGVDRGAAHITLADLFAMAQQEFGTSRHVTLAAYSHPLNIEARCDCGGVTRAVGTDWSQPPKCEPCAKPMRWLQETQVDRVDRRLAIELDILETPLDQLGVQDQGAMIVARCPAKPIRRFLLRTPQ
jgi:hypothetical protein